MFYTQNNLDYFSMEEAAKECGFKSRRKLFEFLRRYNIIRRGYPSPEFVIMEYFDVNFCKIWGKGVVLKTVPAIRVSQKGLKFISDLHKLVTKDAYVSA